ncbi:hypothetical protein CFC21_013966 [Triticum aestivum]|uniref:DUF6598 domain-containing protein n=3 Tax=Triticum aestivum TaxID=4565 RepID=A0A3B6A1K0_WHEAT|nr:hypothetical protein CFC21_013966 [Triticum aestivum]
MTLTDPAGCLIDIGSGYCKRHPPSRMFQIFSLKLAKTPTDDRPIQLYGYIAVRDHLDLLLNYVVNFRRDDPISVEQGSSISMIGPKRGIDLSGNIVVEYDMRIKTEEVKHDLQLMDGASMIRHKDLQDCRAFTRRIHGDHGAIDLTASALDDAVEATVEVVISEVRSGFALRLGCFIGGVDEEIPIFDGVVGSEAHGLKLKRFVLAVAIRYWMKLEFKVAPESARCQFAFMANNHGVSCRNMKMDFALFSVKVTWSSLPLRAPSLHRRSKN